VDVEQFPYNAVAAVTAKVIQRNFAENLDALNARIIMILKSRNSILTNLLKVRIEVDE